MRNWAAWVLWRQALEVQRTRRWLYTEAQWVEHVAARRRYEAAYVEALMDVRPRVYKHGMASPPKSRGPIVDAMRAQSRSTANLPFIRPHPWRDGHDFDELCRLAADGRRDEGMALGTEARIHRTQHLRLRVETERLLELLRHSTWVPESPSVLAQCMRLVKLLRDGSAD